MFFRKTKANIFTISLSILLSIFVSGCGKTPELAGFDQKAWQKDTRSCQNIRPTLLKSFEEIRHQLTGLSHTQIIEVLGKPEGESLETSGQRVYYYFIQPGAQCQSSSLKSNAARVAIRFDALDRVNEVMFINP